MDRLKKEGEKSFDCHDYMSECTVEILLGEFFHVFLFHENLMYRELLLYILKFLDLTNTSIAFFNIKEVHKYAYSHILIVPN